MRAWTTLAALALVWGCSESTGGSAGGSDAGARGAAGTGGASVLPDAGAGDASGGAGGRPSAGGNDASSGGVAAAHDGGGSSGKSADAGDAGPPGTCLEPLVAVSGPFDTTSARVELAPSCASVSGAGPGLVYRFVSASAGRLEVQIASSSDLGLSLWGRCGGTELDCVDGPGGDEQLVAPVEAGVPLSIVVSGHATADEGPFTLHTSFKAAACGDGALDGGETCDDRNVASGDGCSATCTLEACAAPGDLSLAVKLDGAATGRSLVTSRCANRLSGPEAVHRFTAPVAGVYRFTLKPAPDLDLVLSLGSACPPTRGGACVDATFAGGTETATVTLAAGQEEYVLVEGWGVPDVGAYSLEVTQGG